MEIFGSLNNFILKFVAFISQLVKSRADQSHTLVQPPQLADTAEGHHFGTDVEEALQHSEAPTGKHYSTRITRRHMQAENAAEEHRNGSNNHTTSEHQPPSNNPIQSQCWPLIIITSCLTAVGTAVQAVQTIKDVPVHKSIQFHCSRMALAFSLAYLAVSVYVRPYSDAAALMFEHLAVISIAIAFILVTTMVDFPRAVIIDSVAIFIVSPFAVFLTTYLWRKLAVRTVPLIKGLFSISP